jgi:hypothetical protein
MQKFVFTILILALFACNKNTEPDPDCEKLANGLTTSSDLIVKTEIEKITSDLLPEPSVSDSIGHQQNIMTLIDRLNEKCQILEASFECYTCIHTYPLTSKIRIEYAFEDLTMYTEIELFTPENDILRFADMHSYLPSEN